MATDKFTEIRNTRLEKIARLRDEFNINPYPATSGRTHNAQVLTDDFDQLEGQTVTVAGRMMSWRKQGKLAFANLHDQSGAVQLFIQRNNLAETTNTETGEISYADIKILDVGDLIEVRGEVIRNQRGIICVLASQINLLSKAIRPLPDKWSGIKDREAIVRKRYLDTIMNREVFDRYAAIAKMHQAIRAFLTGEGFVEFTTPVIQPQYGGGTAEPFRTHVNAIDADMYLAISHQLYLKRLLVAGYEKVFTIGRYFRNEGIDRSHHPEFSMVETMAAYKNYEYNMDLVERMFRYIADHAFGKTTFTVLGNEVDFAQPWQRLKMTDITQEVTGIDFTKINDLDAANAILVEHGIDDPQPSPGHALVRLFEEKVEPTLIQPTLVYGHPIEISPLAKPMADNPRYVERFEIFIGGMECGDNWSEQNDPVQLLETWQQFYDPENPDSGDFHNLDFDFIEAIEHGLPPATGIGPGLERMAMIFTEQEHIDDVIFFPLRRRNISATNAALYGLEASDT